MSVQNIAIQAQPFLNIYGMLVSNDTTSPNTVVNVASGQCRDSNDVMDIVFSSSVAINAASNGLGGLDTGTFAASKVYGVFAVADSSNKHAPSAMISLASNSYPLMPFGYDSYRLIGYAVSDASVHFLKMYTLGTSNWRVMNFDAPQATAVTAGNATSYTATNLSALVPPIENLLVNVAYSFTPGAASRVLNLTPGNATGNALTITGQVTSVVVSGNAWVMSKVTSAIPEIDYKVSNSGDAVAISVAGFMYSI